MTAWMLVNVQHGKVYFSWGLVLLVWLLAPGGKR